MIKDLFLSAENYFNEAKYPSAIDALLQASELAQQIADWEAYVRAQNELGIVHKYLSKYENAFAYLFEAQKAGEKHLSVNNFNIAQTYDMLGCVYGDEHKYEQSNECFLKALTILQQTTNYQRELANTYNNLGWCLSEMGKYTESLDYHQSALKIRLNTIEQYPNEVAQTYNNMGACYIFIGDTNTALIYYQKALQIWLNTYGEKHPQTALAYNNIGLGYSQQADFKMAIQYYEKALQLRTDVFGETHPLVAQCFENIAYCLMKMERFNEALEGYQKGLQIRRAVTHENHPSLVKIYRNLGACYLEMNQPDIAFQYLTKALQIHQQVPEQQVEKIVIYNTLGKYYDDTQQYTQAIEAFHIVLKSAIPSFNEDDVYAVPSLEKYYHGIKLGYALNYKAKIFLAQYLQNDTNRDLITALTYFKKSIQVLNENRRRYKTEDSKLIHAKLVIGTYEYAIFAAYLLYKKTQNHDYFHTAFAFAELSKSYVLFSKLKEAAAKISAHIPTEILQKEQNLQTEMAALDKRIQQLKLQINNQTANPEQQKMVNYLQGKYFDISFQYDQIIEEIEQNYPQYYQLKYDLETAHAANIQQQLQPQKTLVNYFVGAKNLFIFAISKHQFHFHHLPKPDDLNDTIEYIHDAIGMGDEEDLKDLGEQLFEQLLEPILEEEPHCQQLVIIPDDCLHRLPFDILARWTLDEEENTFRNFSNTSLQNIPKDSNTQTHKHYLIESFQISYHYSATLWFDGQKNKKATGQAGSFLGIAPINFDEITQEETSQNTNITFKSDFNAGGKLKELTDSKAEIQKIHQLFTQHKLPSTALLYDQATKQNFIQNLVDKKYIVLSSHGFYNEENPSLSGIYFARSQKSENVQNHPISNAPSPISHHQSLSGEERKLYISDTFHLPLNADLVVLSSCESGIGELQKGEGMLALNRGFLYAGASNIIYSLFKVPDAASQLTPNFFRYVLEENCSYAAALQKAKLDLMAEGQEPLYWAGFALVGR
ncbi:MAG: tetratricopeptide repeat protein [Chitinophagales bacterium]